MKRGKHVSGTESEGAGLRQHVCGDRGRPPETCKSGRRARRTGDPGRGRAGRAGPWVGPGCWAGVHGGVRAPGSARTGLPGVPPPPQAADSTDTQSWRPHRHPTAASDATKEPISGAKVNQCERSGGAELRARSSAQTLLADPELSGTPRSPGKVRPSPLLASHTRIPLRRSAEPGWQVWAAEGQSGTPPQAQAAWDLQPDPGTPLGVCVSASRCHQSNEATRPCSCQQTRRVPARTNALTAENATLPP